MLCRRRVVIGCRASAGAAAAGAATAGGGDAGGVGDAAGPWAEAGVLLGEDESAPSGAGEKSSRPIGETELPVHGEAAGAGEGASAWERRGVHGDVSSGDVERAEPAEPGDKLDSGLASKVVSYRRIRSSTKAGSVKENREGGVDNSGDVVDDCED